MEIMLEPTFLLSYMDVIGGIGERKSPETPFGPLGMLIYVFGILGFVFTHYLIWSRQEKEMPSVKVRFVFTLFQLTFCSLIGAYEFWLRPKFKAYYQALFGEDVKLPDVTQVFLHMIPSGTFTIAMIVLCLGSWWMIGTQSLQKLAQIFFILIGLIFLIVMPIALFAPQF